MSAAGEDFWEEIATASIDVPQDRVGDVTPTPPPKPPGLKERRGAVRADRINARAAREQQAGHTDRRFGPRMIAGAALGLVFMLLIAVSLTGSPQQGEVPAPVKPVAAAKPKPRAIERPVKKRRAKPVRARAKAKAAPKPQAALAPAAQPATPTPTPAAAASQPAAGSCDFVPTC